MDEVHVIRGALQLKERRVSDALTALPDVFMLDEEVLLDDAQVRDLVHRGHSRIPVYRGEPGQFVGILLLKSLLERPSGAPVRVGDMALRPLVWVDADGRLDELLRTFRKGHTHMAAVRRVGKGGVQQVRGIITLEDIMEQLLQDDIEDETDVDHQQQAVEDLERPTPAEAALEARQASAHAVIDMAKGTAKAPPSGASAARAPPRPSFLDTLRSTRRVPRESETFLLGPNSDDDDDRDL